MRLAYLVVLALVVSQARASAGPAPDAFTRLTDRVIADAAAGRPLVVQVHVPLCDNSIIACGNAKLGDGDHPETNLYWATTPGLGAWFARRGSGWRRVLATDRTGDPDVLALHVYRRTVPAPASWRARGAPSRLEIDLVIFAWRGKAIDRALAAYAADLSGAAARPIALPDHTTLEAGGRAQIVAWVGHNRLMDLDRFAWPPPGRDPQGLLAIACETAPYMKRDVPAPTRAPLLMTTDFLFANAAPLEAAVLAFAAGGDYRRIRRDAAAAYAGVQDKSLRHVLGAFTNPGDPRWSR